MTMQFRNLSIEESVLVAVNNTAIGDGDGIERIHCQKIKDREPETQVPDARYKEV